MSTSDAPSTAVLPLRSVTLPIKNKAWMEVKTNADHITEDAFLRKIKAAAYQPTFSDASACNELTRGITRDYEKVG